MRESFSRVISRVCATSGRTLVQCEHGGAAARPQLVAQPANAAICTMGARGGKLNENLKMRIRAEAGSTLMIDSTTATKLAPNKQPGVEYGIGIHAGVENGALLVITPEAHVPSSDAFSGLWARYDLSPEASLVSVALADLKSQSQRTPKQGGRYTCRMRVHRTEPNHVGMRYGANDGDGWRADESLPYINESCNEPSISSCGFPFAAEPSWTCDWTYGRRFRGLVMGTPTTNVIASVLLSGERSKCVEERFRSVEASLKSHAALGLSGEVHLALQDVRMSGGGLAVARLASEYREDMHRLLHHCLAPLQAELGVEPYARMIRASKTAASIEEPPFFVIDPDAAASARLGTPSTPEGWQPTESQKMHVQHSTVNAS